MGADKGGLGHSNKFSVQCMASRAVMRASGRVIIVQNVSAFEVTGSALEVTGSALEVHLKCT